MRQNNITDLDPKKQDNFSRHDLDLAIRTIMSRSGSTRDIATLALGLAALKMAEGRK